MPWAALADAAGGLRHASAAGLHGAAGGDRLRARKRSVNVEGHHAWQRSQPGECERRSSRASLHACNCPATGVV